MRETSAARFYELMVITAPEGTPEELVETVDQINGYITNAGGAILRSNYDSPWGRRRLAYPIRHHSQDVRDGFYTLIHMEIHPDRVIDIERDLKLNDRLMRYLVLQLASEPVFPEPESEEGENAEGASQDTTATATSGEQTASAPQEPVVAEPAQLSEATAEDRRTTAEADPEALPAAENAIETDSGAKDAGAEVTPVAEEAEEETDVSE